MNNQQILEKAINKAVDNGWSFDVGDNSFEVDLDGTNSPSIRQNGDWLDHERIIFNHDFVKALWGEKKNLDVNDPRDLQENWKHHLQQMVIAKDPIKYLGENI